MGKEFFSDSYLVCARNVNPFIDVSVSENKCDPLKKKRKINGDYYTWDICNLSVNNSSCICKHRVLSSDNLSVQKSKCSYTLAMH